jgi:hypothetical protein
MLIAHQFDIIAVTNWAVVETERGPCQTIEVHNASLASGIKSTFCVIVAKRQRDYYLPFI